MITIIKMKNLNNADVADIIATKPRALFYDSLALEQNAYRIMNVNKHINISPNISIINEYIYIELLRA